MVRREAVDVVGSAGSRGCKIRMAYSPADAHAPPHMHAFEHIALHLKQYADLIDLHFTHTHLTGQVACRPRLAAQTYTGETQATF